MTGISNCSGPFGDGNREQYLNKFIFSSQCYFVLQKFGAIQYAFPNCLYACTTQCYCYENTLESLMPETVIFRSPDKMSEQTEKWSDNC